MSAVWNFFTVCETDATHAVCKICEGKVPRGGNKPNSFNTTNLIRHLKKDHKEEHGDYLKQTAEREKRKAEKTSTRPLLVQRTIESTQSFNPHEMPGQPEQPCKAMETPGQPEQLCKVTEKPGKPEQLCKQKENFALFSKYKDRAKTHQKKHTTAQITDEAFLLLEKLQALGVRAILLISRPGKKPGSWVSELLSPRCQLTKTSAACLKIIQDLFDIVIQEWTQTGAPLDTAEPPDGPSSDPMEPPAVLTEPPAMLTEPPVPSPICAPLDETMKGGSSTSRTSLLLKNEGYDFVQEDMLEDFPSLHASTNQNYIPDAVLPLGEPWLQGGPSRAMLSVPSCLRLWREPVSGRMGVHGPSNDERAGEFRVYTKNELQQGIMFGPFVGEVTKGQLLNTLKHAWAIRDDSAFYYVDASDENKSNWMRYVSYASNEEDHNLIVFQFYRQIYYRVSQTVPEGAELKVCIGKDYSAMLGLGMDENERCDITDKEMMLRNLQDIQVVTLPDANVSSLWSDNSQSQSPMPLISEVASMLQPEKVVDSATASTSVPTSSCIGSLALPTYHLERYDFIPGAEKLLTHPHATQNRAWYFFGFEPDPTGRPLDRNKVVCKLCGEHVSCGGGTVNIQNHLTQKHHIKPRDVAKDLRDLWPQTTGQKSQLLSSLDMLTSTPLSKPIGTLPQIMATQMTDAISNFLIRDLHPPALVEGEGFKRLIHTLLPSCKMLPSACLIEDILKDLHTKSKKNLFHQLKTNTGSEDIEDNLNYTAPIEFEERRRGRPRGSQMELPHCVTLSVDVWFHDWQGNTERYATLWAHYIDANFSFHNLAITTQRLAENVGGDYSLGTLQGQVKVMAQEWGISQPNLVLLGGEGSEKLRLGLKKRERTGEPAGSGPCPNSTTFLEREDSVSSDELRGLESRYSSSEGLPSIPCFFSAVQGCIEEVMSHPVISKTLSHFQIFLLSLFPLHTPKKSLSQLHIESLLLTMPRKDQAQLKSWAHSRPGWNKLYTLCNTLLRHQNLVGDMIKELRGENPTSGDATDPTTSESTAADNSYTNSTSSAASSSSSSSSGAIFAPKRSEWKVLEELCSVLKPLDVACQTLAKDPFPRLSLIKPILTGLLSRHLVTRPGDSSAILKEVKRMMKRNLAGCYDNPVVNRALCVACSLDPQFHGLGFMELKEQTATFDWLKKEAVRIVKEDKRRRQARRQGQMKRSSSPLSSETDGDCLRRRSKRLKEAPQYNFKEIVDSGDESDMEENESAEPGSQGGLSGMEFLLGDLFGSVPQGTQSSVEESVDREMSVYRADKGASMGVEPLQWWRTKAGQFPLLATVARAYLAAPAVAGSAAQGFLQEGGGATCRKRVNIPPESLDDMLFLHYNHTFMGVPAKKDDKL